MNLRYIIVGFILLSGFLLHSENINVYSVKFVNSGTADIDYLSEIIQGAVNNYFGKIPGYCSPVEDEINSFFVNRKVSGGDLVSDNLQVLLAGDLSVKYIIEGNYYVRDRFLVIDFAVKNMETKTIIYRSSKFGESGIGAINTIYDSVKQMISDFTGFTLEFSQFSIKADMECRVIINGKYYGNTNYTGEHIVGVQQVEVYYDNILIYNKEHTLIKGEHLTVEIRVFSRICINTNSEYRVYINGIYEGNTPFDKEYLIGMDYRILLATCDNPAFNAAEFSVLLENMSDYIGYVEGYGNLKILSPNLTFDASLNEFIFSAPAVVDQIPVGHYINRIFIRDGNDKHYFYFSELNIFPGTEAIIDISDIQYKALYGLAAIPSALQFYNRDYIKAGLILGGFTMCTLIGALSGFFSDLYYTNIYKTASDRWNLYGVNSGYTVDQIEALYEGINIVFLATLIPFIVISLGIWIYSVVDGVLKMNRLLQLFNSEYKVGDSLNVRFEIQIIE